MASLQLTSLYSLRNPQDVINATSDEERNSGNVSMQAPSQSTEQQQLFHSCTITANRPALMAEGKQS
eukprot:scaffold671099_cov102-Prasinocladus_malaysianus.AAC.1